MGDNTLVVSENVRQRLPEENLTQLTVLLGVANGQGTLESLLDDETLISTATSDGVLSKPQKLAVTATASIMQDRIIRLAEGMLGILHDQTLRDGLLLSKAMETQSSLVARLWNMKMFNTVDQAPPLVDEEEGNPNDGEIGKTPPKALITWGNFFAFSAIAIAAAGLIVTTLYSNYKELATTRQARIVELNESLREAELATREADKKAFDANTRAQLSEGRAQLLQQQIDNTEKLAGDGAEGLNEEIKRLNRELVTVSASEATYKSKFNETNRQFEKYQGDYTRIYNRMDIAEKKVAELRTILAKYGLQDEEKN